MNALLISLFFMADTLRTDTVPPQMERVDTLRQVEVRGDTVLPVMEAIMKSLGRQNIKTPPSLGDILEKLSPGINDKITHHFAFKARKKERKHKRDRKVLEEYEAVKTFNDLLREACEREGIEIHEPEKK